MKEREWMLGGDTKESKMMDKGNAVWKEKEREEIANRKRETERKWQRERERKVILENIIFINSPPRPFKNLPLTLRSTKLLPLIRPVSGHS